MWKFPSRATLVFIFFFALIPDKMIPKIALVGDKGVFFLF